MFNWLWVLNTAASLFPLMGLPAVAIETSEKEREREREAAIEVRVCVCVRT